MKYVCHSFVDEILDEGASKGKHLRTTLRVNCSLLLLQTGLFSCLLFLAQTTLWYNMKYNKSLWMNYLEIHFAHSANRNPVAPSSEEEKLFL